MMLNKCFVRIVVLFFTLSCSKNEQKRFVQLYSKQTGITFSNELKNSTQNNILRYLYYYNGGGVAIADFNQDGLADIYFTGNEVSDKLYINKGHLTFKDITEQAGINNVEPWTAGVTHVDINQDGLSDIYICKIGDYRGIKGKNILYVNQGIDSDGIPTFEDEAEKYGLDIVAFSTQAAFFDYDLDGDLDMFLLNHSVHPNRSYGKGSKRQEYDPLSGDKFFRNENGKFIDVSDEVGIFQGKIGFGLGLAVADINNDGYSDMYVGNDFFENDYLYINQKDGTFKELISSDINRLGHTTHFSMGNDIVDINNDGWLDIVSLDMLPEDLTTYKSSGLEYTYQIYSYYLKNDYAPQYMQNTLHLNLGNGSFSEIAFLSGVASTEWSWSPLLADFDHDGYIDMFVTNGIKGATNDMDFINFISDEKIQKGINDGMSKNEMRFIDALPEKKVANYFFRNQGDITFEDVTDAWFEKIPSFSHGGAYADLDNDGDVDIVCNNMDEEAFVLENKTDVLSKEANYFMKVRFEGLRPNIQGIGAKVEVYAEGGKQIRENIISRGYLSSGLAEVHMGLGRQPKIDSMKVIWPRGHCQVLQNVKSNQTLIVKEQDAKPCNKYNKYKKQWLENTEGPIAVQHKDNETIEFNRDVLIPYAKSNQGPKISVADINGDSLEDLFIGGGKFSAGQLFVQTEKGTFLSAQSSLFELDSKSEDTSSIFFDSDGDSDMDLLVVSGGNEFTTGTVLNPRLYKNTDGVFEKEEQFKDVFVHASSVQAIDIDNDGDLDVSITANVVPKSFGKTPRQYIFENDGRGNFKDITATFAKDFSMLGNVEDVAWVDLNKDGLLDLVAVGCWMPVSIFIHTKNGLELQDWSSLRKTHGWWNCIEAKDFDKDGDVDFMLGNWGLNTRLKPKVDEPVTLYNHDFDRNGKIDPVISYFYKGIETPFASKDELTKQMPFINKKYVSYKSFAESTFKEVFGREIEYAEKKHAYIFANCYIENKGEGKFAVKELPLHAQVSTVYDIMAHDFNGDGNEDVLLVGNNDEISTQLGRLDASHGTILLNDKKGFFEYAEGQKFDIRGAARDIEKITIGEEIYFLVGINKGKVVFLKTETDE